MKNILFFISTIFSLNIQATTYTSDFKVNCSGEVTLKTSSPFFKPTHCQFSLPGTKLNCGRANPIPATGGFKVKAKVTKLNNGCYPLSNKYDLNIFQKEIESVFYLKNPSLMSAIASAKEYQGKTFKFYIDQSYQYSLQGTLPLYPLIIDETIHFNIQTGIGSYTHPIPVDSEKIYGINNLKNLNDSDKLSILNKQIEYAITRHDLGHNKYFELPFENLVQKLVPSSQIEKSKYTQTLFNLFEIVANTKYPPSGYFDFNVGGSDGNYIANILIQNKLIKEGMLEKTIFNYPNFLTKYQAYQLPLSAELMIKVFNSFLNDEVHFGSNSFKKSRTKSIKNIAKLVINKNFYSIFNRKPELVTPQLIKLATKILEDN